MTHSASSLRRTTPPTGFLHSCSPRARRSHTNNPAPHRDPTPPSQNPTVKDQKRGTLIMKWDIDNAKSCGSKYVRSFNQKCGKATENNYLPGCYRIQSSSCGDCPVRGLDSAPPSSCRCRAQSSHWDRTLEKCTEKNV